MKKTLSRTKLWSLGGVLSIALSAASSALACTIFVLVDADRALFFNNEDWQENRTAIWFVPAGKGYFGCAFVGFANGMAQGGLNTEGLAYDVVAGRRGEYRADRSMPRVRGNPLQRMLESCRTVDEAVRFLQTHRVGFSDAQIFLADASGTSAILTPENGALLVAQRTACRALGYGQEAVEKMIQDSVETTLKNGANMMKAAVQPGKFGTKYSCVYDLKTRDIFLYQFQQSVGPVKLSLAQELVKGAHFYNMSAIHSELREPPRPLNIGMWRFPLDILPSLRDTEPKVTAHVRAMITDSANGSRKKADYSEEAWKSKSRGQAAAQIFYQSLGRLDSVDLLERTVEGAKVSYRFRVTFSDAKVLYHFVFDERKRCDQDAIEDIDWL